MNDISAIQTIGDIIAAFPNAAHVFIRHRIDYCCHPATQLMDACQDKGLDTAKFIQEINSEPIDMLPVTNWSSISSLYMANFLIYKCHSSICIKLEKLHNVLDKVVDVQGHSDAKLVELKELYDLLHRALFIHLTRKENVIFPYLISLEAGKTIPAPYSDSSTTSIGTMMIEHKYYVGILFRMLDLLDSHTAPYDFDTRHNVLYDGLSSLTEILMWCFYLENYFLFPSALNREVRILEES